MTAILGFALKALSFARSNWRLLAILGAVLVLIGGVWGIYAKGRSDGAESVRAKDRAALEAASARQAKAVAEADQQRLKDTQTVTQLQADLSHADDAEPDAKPSAARIALGCVRLRNAGRDVSKLPECAGSNPAAQARSGG